MKKVLTLLFGGLIALTLFVSTGNTAKAEEPEDCSCHELKPLTGSERNKIVADLISSKAFKEKKKELKAIGYQWNGAHGIEVIQPYEGFTLVGVPFTTFEGNVEMVVFINGEYADPSLITNKYGNTHY
ncbi:hypothetical protein [Neobacillus bataviensis]|uniref:hypothetical protein n=1 Tax=Neobacillus bataviensis TaxID=220685 RepID=UPI001CBEE464|nr:hypothetical protein [Neobacillus bataviensis]